MFEISETIGKRKIEVTNYVAKKYRVYEGRNNKNQNWPQRSVPVKREVFQDYKLIETTNKEIVSDSASSNIISSGSINIKAINVVNDNSFVAAGEDISIMTGSIINRGEVEENKTRKITYAGKPDGLNDYQVRQVSDLKKAYQNDVEELERGTHSMNRGARPAAERALKALLSEGEPKDKNQPAEILVWNQKNGLDRDGNPLEMPDLVTKKPLKSDVTVKESSGTLSPATIQAGGTVSIHAAESIGNGAVEESQSAQLQRKDADIDTGGIVSTVDISLGQRKAARPESSKPTLDASHDRRELGATGSGFDFGDTESLRGNDNRASVKRQENFSVDIDQSVGMPSRTSKGNDEIIATHYISGSAVANPDFDDVDNPAAVGQRASVSSQVEVDAGREADASRQKWPVGDDGPIVRRVDVDASRQDRPVGLDGSAVSQRNDADASFQESPTGLDDSVIAQLPHIDAARQELLGGLDGSVVAPRVDDQPADGGDRASPPLQSGGDAALVVGGDSVGEESKIATRSLVEVDFVPVDYHGVEFERVSPASLSSFRLPKGDYGLFVKSATPKSHYLIETNPEFTAVENVIGSDYLLDKLDYSDDSAYQLLGDGRYESRLIRDAIQASTGSRFLDDRLDDDYQQYRYLMDNAITAQDALQLTVGVGLTPEQTAALTHDIVWLESQEIDGETVLAPVLYLAQVDERNVRGGSLIQGRDIELIAGGDLINVGTIKAANDLTMNSGGSILQGGLVEAGNRLDMSAVNDIRNAVAGEIRGRNVSLKTLKGDIVNDRTAITAGYDKSYQTYLDAGGLIFSQKDLRLDAGRDLINRSEILSLGAIEANAGRDILLDAVKDSWKEDTAYGAGRIETATTHLGSSLEAANDLVLTAGEDISVLGSRISTGGALELWSGDDITVSALEDSYQRIDTGSDGRKHAEKSTTTQTASQLLSDGRAALAAGRDIDISASRLDSGADISLTAANDVRIVAGEQSRRTESAGFSRRKTSERIEQVASRIDATGDLTVAAGRDIDMVASRLESGESLRLSAGRDLTLNSAADSLEENYRSSSTKQIHREIRQQGSELRAGDGLTLVAGSDVNVTAGRLEAGDQAYLFGGGNVNLLAANDEDYDFYEKKVGGGLFGGSNQRDEVTDTRAVGTTVETGGDLTIVSGGDQTYEAARLDSGEDLSLTSGGGITFAGALDTHTESHEKSKSNWAWQSAKGKGQTDQTLRQSELIAQGQTLIQAADGLNIDISQVDQQTVSQAIDAMVTANPDLAWLEQAEARGNIDWRTVKEIHDSWDYSQSGVSPAVGMAIAIIAAAATSGAASSAIGMLSGTTTATTATTAASAWAAGTTTVASGWANAALSGAIAGAVGGAAGAASQGQDWQDPALHGAITGGLANYLAGGTYYQNPLNKVTNFGEQISQSSLLDAGKVLGSVAMQKTWSHIAEKMAKGVGLSEEELNWVLMASSIAGDQLPGIGNRYKANDWEFNLTDYVGERGVMDRGLPGLPFDAADIALGYQGLPDASVRAYLADQGFGGVLAGHSLGTLSSNYIVSNGLADHAELFSLPFGNIAAPSAHLTIGSGDLINGGYLGKFFNPDAIVAPITPLQHPFYNYKDFVDAHPELYPTGH